MSGILVFLLVFGVLVFVHEMGHFVAAKACGVYVDRFSLGMPPRLLGFKYGETDYCIGALPIGGYVKMAGQEDSPMEEEEREKTYGHVPPDRWFNNRPRWQRAIIFIAGPAMNLVLGFVIFCLLGAMGSEVPLSQHDNRLGAIEKDSPAASAPMFVMDSNGPPPDLSVGPDTTGWKTGDRVVSINGKPMSRIIDIAMEGALSAGTVARVEIERTAADGTVTTYISPVEPQIMPGDREKLPRFGVAPFETALIGHVFAGSPAEEAGLLPGDVILRAQGEAVDSPTFGELVRELPAGSNIEIAVERDGVIIPMAVATRGEGRFEDVALDPPLNPVLYLPRDGAPQVQISDGAFLGENNLTQGDRVVSVDGQPADKKRLEALFLGDIATQVAVELEHPARFLGLLGKPSRYTVTIEAGKLMQAIAGHLESANPIVAMVDPDSKVAAGLKRKDVIIEMDGKPATVALAREVESTRVGETIPIKVQRPSVLFGAGQKAEVIDTTITVASTQMIGVGWDTKTITRTIPATQLASFAWDESWRVTAQIWGVLGALVTGGLGASALGGPVMIYTATTAAAQSSLYDLLEFVAMISINLAIFNLLPLPVLDGGQLVFLGIEAIRRKPIDVRIMEAVQQFGILLLLGLMVYVTFNDVSRIVTNLIP